MAPALAKQASDRRLCEIGRSPIGPFRPGFCNKFGVGPKVAMETAIAKDNLQRFIHGAILADARSLCIIIILIVLFFSDIVNLIKTRSVQLASDESRIVVVTSLFH